jgi:hypothetical protein
MTNKILSFLRDQIWQFIGAVLGLTAILVAYNIFFLQKPVKNVQIVLLSNASLVDVNPEIVDNIEVYYKGDLAKNITLLDFQILNDGNQPIVASDYSKPISLFVNPSFEIVDSSIIESNPANIGMNLTKVSPNQTEISPVLLNPDDWVKIRFILIDRNSSNQKVKFQADGRIAGVKQIEVTSPDSKTQLKIGGLTIDIPSSGMDLVAIVLTLVVMASSFKDLIEIFFRLRRKKGPPFPSNRA